MSEANGGPARTHTFIKRILVQRVVCLASENTNIRTNSCQIAFWSNAIQKTRDFGMPKMAKKLADYGHFERLWRHSFLYGSITLIWRLGR